MVVDVVFSYRNEGCPNGFGPRGFKELIQVFPTLTAELFQENRSRIYEKNLSGTTHFLFDCFGASIKRAFACGGLFC